MIEIASDTTAANHRTIATQSLRNLQHPLRTVRVRGMVYLDSSEKAQNKPIRLATSKMALDRDVSRNGQGSVDDGMRSETALDWFRRSQRHRNNGQTKRRRRNGSPTGSSLSWNDNDERDDDGTSSDSSDVHAATDPSTAAWRFLRYGKSGIAPIDAAWKRSRDDRRACQKNRTGPGNARASPHPPLFLPPVTVLEGPKDVGKTLMLLTLAARFVVATRSSRYKDVGDGKRKSVEARNKRQQGDQGSASVSPNNDEADEDSNNDSDDRPNVLLLDSAYDFSVAQLVTVIRSTLEREQQRQRARRIHPRGRPPKGRQRNAAHKDSPGFNGGYNGDTQHHYQHDPERELTHEFERQEKERSSLQKDMEDCLSRIHVIQVDNGSTGWVPMLEVLTHRLSENRRRRCGYGRTFNSLRPTEMEPFTVGPPMLLLWDGFLSDVVLSSNDMTTPAIFKDGIGYSNNTQVLFDSPGAQELLRQLSRLMQKEADSLWLVLTTRTVPAGAAAAASKKHTAVASEHSGIGLRVTEWIRKEEDQRRKRRENNDSGSSREQEPLHAQRMSYRIRLDRRQCGRTMSGGESRYIPSTAAAAAALFAQVVGCGSGGNFDSSTNGNRSSVATDEKIPYSISLGGILS